MSLSATLLVGILLVAVAASASVKDAELDTIRWAVRRDVRDVVRTETDIPAPSDVPDMHPHPDICKNVKGRVTCALAVGNGLEDGNAKEAASNKCMNTSAECTCGNGNCVCGDFDLTCTPELLQNCQFFPKVNSEDKRSLAECDCYPQQGNREVTCQLRV